jgi:hypothetical protein
MGNRWRVAAVQVWEQTFEAELGPLPPLIHGPCCAEFLVSRDRIRAHPRRGLPCCHVIL